jgi:cellulose synthase/poly-beta-1,6-N-acetylglucosamine synthase-like glycosyltransferase
MQAWDTGEPREVESVQGAAMLLRQEALKQIGLLDEAYFMYSEEIDLCLRLRRANWSIHWVPEAKIIHFGGQSTRQVPGRLPVKCFFSSIGGKSNIFGNSTRRQESLLIKSCLGVHPSCA